MADRLTKAERMERRRATGTRAPPIESKPLEHRGPAYRVAHACFRCRRSFKLQADPMAPAETRQCPNCGGELHWMGRTFRAPKKTDAGQWRKVETLWLEGFRFGSYRSRPDAEPLPETEREVADFIRRNPNHPFRTGPRRTE